VNVSFCHQATKALFDGRPRRNFEANTTITHGKAMTSLDMLNAGTVLGDLRTGSRGQKEADEENQNRTERYEGSSPG
jgi:hypothetical protein